MTPNTALLLYTEWFKVHMPYQFRPIECGRQRHVFLPLNRHYKPLGLALGTPFEEKAYLHTAIAFTRDPALLQGIWINEGLYLYNNHDAETLRTYFTRLAKLLARRLSTPNPV